MKLWIVLATGVIGFGFLPAMAGDEGQGRPPRPPRDRDGEIGRGQLGTREPLGGGRRDRGPGPERRGGRPGRPGEFGDFGGEEVTDAEIDVFLQMLSESLPKRYAKLSSIKKKNPEAFRRMMRQRGPMLKHVLGAKQRSPKLAGLLLREHFFEEEMRDLERRHRDASKGEKEKIEAEVRTVLDGLFDVKLDRQAMEIAHLEERLNDHKATLEARKKNKAEILEREFENRFRPELSFE